jgi:hypothetical protein
MTDLEKPLSSLDQDLSGALGLPYGAAIRAAILLALLIAYGVAFAILYPLAQASVSKSAAEGNDPMLHIGS